MSTILKINTFVLLVFGASQAAYQSNQLTAIPNLNSLAEQNVADQCFQPISCPANGKYRTMDGTCNNKQTTWWGAANTPYVRLLKPNYRDANNNYRVSVVDGSELPSARVLTTALLQPLISKQDRFTRMFLSFGQVVAHDVLANPRSQGTCCTSTGGTLQSAPAGCHPIVIPDNDPFYSQFGRTCQEYRQSDKLTCSSLPPGTLLPTNRGTHFIDASFIYGSNANASQRLRTGRNGKLLVSTISGRQFLPTQAISNCPFAKNICYNSGDPRANQNLDLAVSETIWLRFHNFLAHQIAELHPAWAGDDETLFQETRRWLIAFLQQITYGEWLPRFLGYELSNSLRLLPQTSGYASGYDSTLNPSSLADFAGAAFRTLHSQIPDFTTININGTNQSVRFASTMERAGDFLQVEGVYDSDILDLASTPQEELDQYNSFEMLNHVVQFSSVQVNGTVSFGDDLIATDIQRGLDYGLQSYNDYRQLCGLPPFRTFEEIAAVFGSSTSSLLSKYYKSPQDIDYYIGSVIEATVLGVRKAQSLRCVWGEAFSRYKYADRYYFEFGDHPGSFKTNQLDFIRSITLAHLVCIGGNNIEFIQPNVFDLPNEINSPIPCASLVDSFVKGLSSSFSP